jgi:hypothetical protein
MITPSTIIRAFDLRHIGTCPTCIRVSFWVMILSWLIVAIALILDLKNAAPVISVVASALTLLWLAHIIMRAINSVRPDRLDDPSRRLALGSFAVTAAKAAIGAVVMSAAVFPSQLARADSGCGGWAGNSGCVLCGDCYRQTANCQCYPCRSCGNNCSGPC